MTDPGSDTLVSVIIPAFNAAAYLGEAIRSALTQDFPEIEILVIDDGSADDTLSVAGQFGEAVRIIAASHRGLAAARNRGISEARGGLLLHLDADDVLTEGSISARVKIFNSGVDIVVGQFECFLTPELRGDLRHRFVVPETPQYGHLPGSSIVRATSFKQFGILDESFRVNADLDWWVRARDLGAKTKTLDQIMVRRRIHGRNMSTLRQSEFAAAQLRIVKSSLQRRRVVSEELEST